MNARILEELVSSSHTSRNHAAPGVAVVGTGQAAFPSLVNRPSRDLVVPPGSNQILLLDRESCP